MNAIFQSYGKLRLARRLLIVVTTVAAGAWGSLAYASTKTTHGHATSNGASISTSLSVLSAKETTSSKGQQAFTPVLAKQFNNARLYVSEGTSADSGELLACLTEVEAAGGSYQVCGIGDNVAEHGLIGENVLYSPTGVRISIDMLMPNGTNHIVATGNHGGERRSVTLQNNVAEIEGVGIESINYTLPDGTVREVPIPSRNK